MVFQFLDAHFRETGEPVSRIGQCFERLADEKKKALVIYIMAGDPDRSVTVKLMHEMVAAGVSMIELGVPFTDPEADGPVIQEAGKRALAQNISLRDALAMVAEFRQRDSQTPVVLMGYLNPIEKMGYEAFATTAAQAGVDGTITVNVPPEESDVLDRFLAEKGIDPVYLLAPTTSEERARLIFSKSRGFAYYVSLKGITGAATLDVDDVRTRLAVLRQYATVPVVVGFGIKTGAAAASVARFADGIAIGAAVVGIMEAYQSVPAEVPARVGQFVGEIRAVMDVDGA